MEKIEVLLSDVADLIDQNADINGMVFHGKEFIRVVRCKDCRYYQPDGEWYDDDVCKVHPDDDNGYCAWGERREDE